ncbi:cytochrome b-c1 complex subunit 7 [Galendromus occidentalis]|uniref:Cytochrome b-c1 complex subunit 7 n=1 Tax=Galendromus occidentalis TaxID=34638 RepID=A0AAJ6VVD8_9ACAR|nr:cytochrome b-c1 complex subunit 7 [Galendromus occidentalis]
MLIRLLTSKLPENLKKVLYKADRYHRLGCLHDDMWRDSPLIDEAVRRLPKKVQDERNYRIVRAFQLSLTHTLLPEKEWTSYDADHYYLEPYIKEVEEEMEEIKQWLKTH